MCKVYFSCPKFTVRLVMSGTVIRKAAPIVKAVRGADHRCPYHLGRVEVRWTDHRRETIGICCRSFRTWLF